MICQNCKTQNYDDVSFCLECGTPLVDPRQMPTMALPATPTFGNRPLLPTGAPLYSQQTQQARTQSNKPLLIVLAALAVASIGALAYFFLLRPNQPEAVLPDHFGIFVKNKETLNELRRGDFRDVMQGRDAILGDATLPRVEAKPTLIIYAEGQDIPVSELKLLQLDSIDASGKISYWNYQVAPIDGHPHMKQLRVAGGLPGGKYAFALLNGYMEDGNHKFWPFQIAADAPAPSDAPQVTMIPTKPKPATTPTPTSTPTTVVQPSATPRPSLPASPDYAESAYCTQNNVVVRDAPRLKGNKIGGLSRGQRVHVIEFSSNYDTWHGITSNWVYVQVESTSARGWVFAFFIKQ